MNSEKELQKYNNDNLKNNEVFPFIDQMVNIFYNDQINELLNDSITGGYDKSIFLMFVVMYFGIHLKLENKNKDEKKQQIKYLMTEFIKDPVKRKMCIDIFRDKFHDSFLEQKTIKNKNNKK